MNRQTKICAVAHILTGFFLLQVLPLAGQSPATGTNRRKTIRLHAPASFSALTKTSIARPAMPDMPLNLAQSLTTSGTITTYAGSAGVPLPVSDTAAITQSLDLPSSVAPDGAGGFYFTSPTHHRVYRVTSEGKLFVVAGDGTAGFSGDGAAAISARLATPLGLAMDAGGNIFIADYDNGRIRKVTPGGVISTVAGNGSYQGTGDGGPATSAGMGPIGVAVDAAGNIFIADTDNDRVRKVNTAGIITAFAGSGNNGFAGDNGPATSARLAAPVGLAVDTSGNVFIADYDNYRIRKVGTNGVITTIAGNGSYEYGGDGGPATSAGIGPTGIAVDATGNLFIADFDHERIRKVTSGGSISTLAGTGTRGFSGDGGPGTAAELRDPFGVAVDVAGNVFIADASNHRVRKVNAAGTISTVAGNGNAIRPGDDPSYGFSGDGGPAISALLSGPAGVALDPAGNLFIADSGNNRIRKVTPAGVITTVAGIENYGFSGDGGPATAAALMFPVAVAVDATGNLFIGDLGNQRVRKVSSSGVITTVAGNGSPDYSGDGGPATSAGIRGPAALAVDSAGNLFIADLGNNRIRKVTPAGIITTVAGNGVAAFGGDGGPATSAALNSPLSVAVDAAGNLFIADRNNQRIRKVTPAGIITTVAGNGTSGYAGDGVPATSAALFFPGGVAVDTAGNLFIADVDNARIRRVTPDGRIGTIAGSGVDGFSGDDGPATSAQLSLGYGTNIATDCTGSLFIPDYGNNRVRRVTFAQATFAVVDRGGVSSVSSGTNPDLTVGYAAIQPNAGSAAPSGVAIFGFRQNNVLVSEAGVPASQAIRSGRIYAEVNGPVNTGLAIANPNNQPVTVSFYFTNSSGDFGNDTTTIPAYGQIAAFLDQKPFNGPATLSGSFTFTASAPVAVIALRGLTNERGEFLITTLPVADLTSTSTGAIVFPHFADGGGWTTQFVLVNPSDNVLTGSVQFVGQSGGPATVAANGQSSSNFEYSIPARSSQKMQTAGTGASLILGSVRIIPASNTVVPSGLAIFSFRNAAGITVAEAGVQAATAGAAFRLYAEATGSIQTGIAVANTSSNAATVAVEVTRLDGSSIGLTGTLSIPANGQTAVFLNQVQGFGSLQVPFQGVLRLSSSAPIAVTGLRSRYNERNDFLITTTPPTNESAAPSSSALFFPHIADSRGYTTQFILFSGRPGSPAGTIQFFSQTGGALNVTLQ